MNNCRLCYGGGGGGWESLFSKVQLMYRCCVIFSREWLVNYSQTLHRSCVLSCFEDMNDECGASLREFNYIVNSPRAIVVLDGF